MFLFVYRKTLFYNVAFCFTLTAVTFLSADVRKLLRASLHLTYNMCATFFRLALYWGCCVQPIMLEEIDADVSETEESDDEDNSSVINHPQHTDTCFSGHDQQESKPYNHSLPEGSIIPLAQEMESMAIHAEKTDSND